MSSHFESIDHENNINTLSPEAAPEPTAMERSEAKRKLVVYEAETDELEINLKSKNTKLQLTNDKRKVKAEFERAKTAIKNKAALRKMCADAGIDVPVATPEMGDAPLRVGAFLISKGHDAAYVSVNSAAFGVQLKAAYIAKHGRKPPYVDDTYKGGPSVRNVYTECDRPLFEAVYATFGGGAQRKTSVMPKTPADTGSGDMRQMFARGT